MQLTWMKMTIFQNLSGYDTMAKVMSRIVGETSFYE